MPLIFQSSLVLAIFEDELQAELFKNICLDISEPVNCNFF